MGSEKISEMPLADPLDGTEYFPIVQGGTNKRATVRQVLQWLNALVGSDNVCLGGIDVPRGSGDMLSPQLGTIALGTVKFIGQLRTPSGNITIDAASGSAELSGECNAAHLIAQDGFTGSGAFTSFDVNEGIVLNAT